jgi:quercetin dioxygenase-like cupin family protein
MTFSPAELEVIVGGLAGRPELWQPFIRHADVRVYEQIWDDDDVNAWLICWSEDQDTGFHDHDDSAAAIVVMEGHVREDRLRVAGEPYAQVFGPGSTFLVEPAAIHRVLHAGSGPAITIHAYAPPLRGMGAYRVTADGQLQRVAQTYEQELRGVPALS